MLCSKIPMVEATVQYYAQWEKSCSAGDGLGTLVIYGQVMDGFQGIL